MRLIGPPGTPARSMAAKNAAMVRVLIAPGSLASSSARCFKRRSFLLNRGSSATSPEQAAQALELAVVAAGHQHMPVGRLEIAIGHDVRMRVAETSGRQAADQIVHSLVHQHGDLTVKQRAIDMLPLSGDVAVMKSGQDRGGGVEASEEIADRQAHFGRTGAGLAIRPSGHAHQTAHALDEEVVTPAHRIGPRLSKPGDGAIDQARVEGREGRVVETIAGQRAGLEVLDHDVRRRGHSPDDLGALGLAEVDRDAAFVPVRAEVIGSVRDASRALKEGRSPCPRVVARARALDLPDLGAEVTEDLRRPGAGENAREIEDLQPAERPRPGASAAVSDSSPSTNLSRPPTLISLYEIVIHYIPHWNRIAIGFAPDDGLRWRTKWLRSNLSQPSCAPSTSC